MDNNSIYIEQLIKVLTNEATDAERLAVMDWQASSDENQKEYNAFVKLWNLSENANAIAHIDIDAEWKHLDKIITPVGAKVVYLQRWFQIAAAVVVLFGLSIMIFNLTQKVTMQSPIAATQTITLPDATVVTLNAGSKFSYSKQYGQKNRNVSLKGEGYFSVSANSQLPFIIDANGASIKVVGTEFNVKAYTDDNEVKVTVVHGVVELFESKEPAKKSRLQAGETGVYMRKEAAVKKLEKPDENDISWKTNSIRFENTKLSDVILILENVYHIDLSVSEKVKDCTVTVVFENDDLKAVLNVIKSTLDLKISLKDDVIFIDGPGCQNAQNGQINQ